MTFFVMEPAATHAGSIRIGLAESRSVPGPWDQAYQRTTEDHHGHHPRSSRAVLPAG